MVRHISSLPRTLATVLLAVMASCTTEPTALAFDDALSAVQDPKGPRWSSNAAVHWNEIARDMVATTMASTPFAIRGYAIMSVAQYHAAITAADDRDRGDRASVHAAISAASVTVLSYLFPAHAAHLEEKLADYLVRADKPGRGDGNVELGIALGRAAGEEMVQRALTDDFFAPWTGSVPTGPGIWYSSTVPPTPPAGAAFGQALPFLLSRTDEFRPAPPPAFDSPEFASAVAEVRQYSDNRTPAQDSIAKFWHLPPGTYAPPGYWNEEAADLARKYRLDERAAAHVLALTNVAMYDGLLASHEAKYHYWLLRPSQADAGITLSVGLPNFPAYPSNHATISAAAAKILGFMFPQERDRLHGRAVEAADSRVIGGIHYRFDGDAGLALGRKVAEWTIAHAPRGHTRFMLK